MIADIELRKGDRMQYAGGTFYRGGGTSWGQCLIGKFTNRGDYQTAYFLSSPGSSITSECYALSIIPEFYNIVIVGKVYGPIDNVVNYKTSALMMLVD